MMPSVSSGSDWYVSEAMGAGNNSQVSPVAQLNPPLYYDISRYDAAMDQAADQVRHWLASEGFGRYAEAMTAEGYDDIRFFVEAEDSEVTELLTFLRMPRGHRHQFRRALTRLRSGIDWWPPRPPPGPPTFRDGHAQRNWPVTTSDASTEGPQPSDSVSSVPQQSTSLASSPGFSELSSTISADLRGSGVAQSLTAVALLPPGPSSPTNTAAATPRCESMPDGGFEQPPMFATWPASSLISPRSAMSRQDPGAMGSGNMRDGFSAEDVRAPVAHDSSALLQGAAQPLPAAALLPPGPSSPANAAAAMPRAESMTPRCESMPDGGFEQPPMFATRLGSSSISPRSATSCPDPGATGSGNMRDGFSAEDVRAPVAHDSSALLQGAALLSIRPSSPPSAAAATPTVESMPDGGFEESPRFATRPGSSLLSPRSVASCPDPGARGSGNMRDGLAAESLRAPVVHDNSALLQGDALLSPRPSSMPDGGFGESPRFATRPDPSPMSPRSVTSCPDPGATGSGNVRDGFAAEDLRAPFGHDSATLLQGLTELSSSYGKLPRTTRKARLSKGWPLPKPPPWATPAAAPAGGERSSGSRGQSTSSGS